MDWSTLIIGAMIIALLYPLISGTGNVLNSGSRALDAGVDILEDTWGAVKKVSHYGCKIITFGLADC